MADIELRLSAQKDESDSCDSDFLDDDDLGLDVDFDEHELPYITSPVFPDLPRLRENKNPWRLNANGVQICDVRVGNDFDFAETKEMGVQVKNENTCRADFSEADDQNINSIVSHSRSKDNLRSTERHERNTCEKAVDINVSDSDHELIREVYIENVEPNKSLPLNKLGDDESSLGIRDEDSGDEFSDTDIEYSDDSSAGDHGFWQPSDDRRWVGVSPAKFRLLRKWFND